MFEKIQKLKLKTDQSERSISTYAQPTPPIDELEMVPQSRFCCDHDGVLMDQRRFGAKRKTTKLYTSQLKFTKKNFLILDSQDYKPSYNKWHISSSPHYEPRQKTPLNFQLPRTPGDPYAAALLQAVKSPLGSSRIINPSGRRKSTARQTDENNANTNKNSTGAKDHTRSPKGPSSGRKIPASQCQVTTPGMEQKKNNHRRAQNMQLVTQIEFLKSKSE